MAEQNIEKGDQVSWSWGAGQPSGEVADVKEKGDVAVESRRGNTVKKSAEPGDPAVHVAREGNDVVKRAQELEVGEKAGSGETNGAVKTGAKREHGAARPKEDEEEEEEEEEEEAAATANGETEAAEEDDADDEPVAKKQKTAASAEAADAPAAKKGRGRPKGGAAKAADKPKRKPKKAATADGQPRRSARNK